MSIAYALKTRSSESARQEGEIREVAFVPVESDLGLFTATSSDGELRVGRVDRDDDGALLCERHRRAAVAAPEIEHPLARHVADEPQFVLTRTLGAVEQVGHRCSSTRRRG